MTDMMTLLKSPAKEESRLIYSHIYYLFMTLMTLMTLFFKKR